MARKAAKSQSTVATDSKEVEASVIALAEQLGAFLGRTTKRAEGWLDNDALKKQVTQIRASAGQILDQVNRAGATAKKTVVKAVKSRTAAKPAAKPAAEPKARASRGPVDAPGKQHRKPPPQEKINRGATDSAIKRKGVKTYQVGRGKPG